MSCYFLTLKEKKKTFTNNLVSIQALTKFLCISYKLNSKHKLAPENEVPQKKKKLLLKIKSLKK